MDLNLSDKQKLLLFKALQNGGRLTMDLAEQLYSSTDSARNAFSTLEFHGCIEKDADAVAGVFRVVRVTPDVKERYREWREAQNDD